MSGAQNNSADKAVESKSATQPASKDGTSPPAKLEEDDEFEDFPAEDWTGENTDIPGGNTHLWEESWDDDDTNDDFSAQLKEELKKADAKK